MSKFFKRLFDIVASASGLIFLSPVFLILIYLIRKNLGSPVFFIQERPGKDGKPFKMIKFRSMRDALDSDGIPLPDGERLTPFGKKLRAASLDELPELWNVLKGEMSLVGPRPLLTGYLPLYNDFQNRRHEMKPGITGWAQVNGRNALSWDEKFACDVWYTDNFSFWLDMKILFLTVKKVLIKEGISAEGEATMPPFTGNRKLAVIGAGGHGKVVAELAAALGTYGEIVFLDDRAQSSINGFPVIGTTLLLENSLSPEQYDVAVAVGNNRIRRQIAEKAATLGFSLPVLIHPNAYVSPSATVGQGSVVMAQAVVQAGSVLKDGVIVNTAATVDHDCLLDAFVHISPGAHLSGNTHIGEESWIGTGACSRQQIRIGSRATIGAGAVIVRDVSDGMTVAGNPAKPLPRKNPETGTA
ncbi:UDP-N-acetylgalactosaminyltransferase [Neisseria meningitidis]|uniref:NeuD/PglB/VioB family sugar acetyltransferase n=1 Tax=Neisseria meningitidis TaxID=487 RepID=UPI000A3B1659|nr:NeuD/PglB/VioB family sugar acetyltransferase [Neisseria meningitidis]OUC31247.1 UDP-N-acetylgalactosaminyltransferase [Neisseria meningitidis]TNL05906.1 UDP-N-acetylgalactosaminyltransferase [Neisseria meningitidis]